MDSRIRFATIASLLSLLATPLLAQHGRDAGGLADRCRDNDWGDDSRAHFCEIRETGFKAGGAVSVDPGANGAILVEGWDRDSVAVIAKVRAQARTDEAARQMASQVRITASGGTISADGPSSSGRSWWSVSFHVLVPRRSDLTAEAVNGPIAVSEVSGKMNLRTVNGPLTLDAVGGDVHARTTNGPLVVALDGAKWDGPGLDGETSNGPVVLTIPANYAAHLETGTVNGPMSIDFPITVQGRISSHHIETDLNGGGPTVRALTTNGPLSVQRR